MGHAGRDARLDAAFVLLLAAIWSIFVAFATGGDQALFYDTFRDTAYAQNILAGRLLTDPCINGQPFWYAPANPIMFAGLARVTGVSVATLYASSAYWLNLLNFILLYLLVRGIWGRAAAVVTMPMLLVGSYWWLMIAAAPMPSVQGVSLNLIGLMCWHRCRQHGRLWPIVTGLCLAASIWHHPLCGLMLAATILVHVLLDAAWLHGATGRTSTTGRTRPGRHIRLRQMLLVAAVAGLLTAPLILHLAQLPKNNPAPFLYVPNEMLDLKFALHAHAPLVVAFGIAGAILIVKRTPAAAWIVAYLIVAAIGQIAGYLGHFLKLPVPYLLPHEFQYHGQLALAVCAAVGVVALARWSHARATHAGRLWLPFGRCIVFACLLTLAPALRYLPQARHYFISIDEKLAGNETWLNWIRDNTPIDATIVCQPETAHFLVCGLAGRKTVALPSGHLNPAVDADQRTADVETMLSNITDRKLPVQQTEEAWQAIWEEFKTHR
ncbi:MAG: hypothetical protein IID33_13070 [Planctomycetes bacterium]|nr:hypothetical protein [Planctomycetota bacterium]